MKKSYEDIYASLHAISSNMAMDKEIVRIKSQMEPYPKRVGTLTNEEVRALWPGRPHDHHVSFAGHIHFTTACGLYLKKQANEKVWQILDEDYFERSLKKVPRDMSFDEVISDEYRLSLCKPFR